VALVVDLSVSPSARFCAQLTASSGDEVIRFRTATSAHQHVSAIRRSDLRDLYLSQGIREQIIEWSDDRDWQAAENLIAGADVVISSYSEGNFDSPYDDARIRELNPRAVHVVVSPFGMTGPYSEYASSWLTDWASSGYLYITGESGRPPLPGPRDMCAYAASYIAAIAMEAGLAHVRSGGPAVTLDISHQEAMLSLHHASFAKLAGGEVMQRDGNDLGPATYPHRSYQCRDGEVFVGVVTDEEWDRFVIAIDRPELCSDARFATGAARKVNARLTDEIVTAWTSHRGAAEAAAFLQERKVPAAECARPEDLLQDPQLEYRRFMRDVSRPAGLADIRLPGSALAGRQRSGALADRHRPTGLRSGTETQPGDGIAALPLAGVTVIDLSIWWAGPLASRMLGDLGANVIRVERPALPREASELPAWHRFVHEDMNRNKRSIIVDLGTPEGLEIVQRLISQADVLIQNYRPGVLERLGLGSSRSHELNPGLVYVSLSGYGSTGPKSGWGTYGTVAEAASSVRALTHYPGEGGMRFGDQLPDGICGLVGVLAALRGLRRRAESGAGSVFDISQLEAYVSLIGEYVGEASLRQAGVAVDGDLSRTAIEQLYRCLGDDDWVAVSVGDADLAVGAGLRLKDIAGAADVDPSCLVADFATERGKQSAAEFLQGSGVAAFPVMTSRDLADDVHLNARQFFTTAQLGGMSGKLPGSPIRSVLHPLTALRRPAPAAGENTCEILRDDLLMSDKGIRKLLETGVVRQCSERHEKG